MVQGGLEIYHGTLKFKGPSKIFSKAKELLKIALADDKEEKDSKENKDAMDEPASRMNIHQQRRIGSIKVGTV